ncbi:FecR family protein [Massilia yuzhufengensis]|uniref:FecR family protein n=1 Tax=Massilia yuzhufengensis TaxID=1164594 RepID=A0A1I1VT27_9BURK|nr:FecR domain-containing protein [Massilia yuzhufengensis]SFD85208.1 FecR family protein [Massilia yuzhufengensis]
MLRQILIFSSLALAAQAYAAEAGKVIFAAGSAQVADKAGAEGTPVQEGELLTTGKDGFLYVKTIDNGLFILRPNTRARIVAYHVDAKNPANTRIKLELLSGVARSKSGDAVKQARQNFRFNTPVAAIGVRGTDFTVFTDQETSRVAVLTGGVVMSGFEGACRPEGGGPCEGAASRELFATQRGQLLQVKRGISAPQLLQSNGSGPDQVSPPRADEPVAKASNSTAAPILDARKSDTLDKLVSQAPVQPAQPQPQPQPTPPTDPITMPPITPPVSEVPVVDVPVVVPPVETVPPVPQLPERTIQWGRWVALAGQPVTISSTAPEGADRLLGGEYAIIRTAGRDYVAPERGSASFVLKDGAATITNANQGTVVTSAAVTNGLLAVDFGKASFVTSFDVVNGKEVFNMMADGSIAKNGLFANSLIDTFTRPQANNMTVNGVLGNEDGGKAAYLYKRILDDNRIINGITIWGASK